MTTPGTLEELIDRHGLDTTPTDLLAELDAALDAGVVEAPLTQAETLFLAEHAGGLAAETVAADPAIGRTARSHTAIRTVERLIADSVTPAQAARILGGSRSRISRKLSAGALYGFSTASGRHRIPRWQFVGDQLLPGLDVITPAIGKAATPAGVAALMRTAQPECAGRTPVEYLAVGGDPTVVAGLLAALDRW